MNEVFHFSAEYNSERGRHRSRLPCRESLEIQKHIHGALGCICLQPVANVIVVHRQFAEDLLLMCLEFCQKFLELCLVENISCRDRPCAASLSIGRGGNSSEKHVA